MVALVRDGGRDNAQIIVLTAPLEEMEVKKPGSCPPPIEADWATRLSDVVGRRLQFPHFYGRSTAAYYARDRIVVYKIGWPTPAATDRIRAQHIVGSAGVSTQAVFVHQEHQTRLPCSHCKVWIRTWLIGKNEHSSG